MVEIYKDLLQKMKIKQSMLDEENGDRTIPTPSGLQPPSPPTPTGMKRKIRIPLCRSVPPMGTPFFSGIFLFFLLLLRFHLLSAMHHATYQFRHGSQVLPYGVSSLETGSCYLQSVPELVIGLQHTRKKMKTQKASRKARKIAYKKLNSTLNQNRI